MRLRRSSGASSAQHSIENLKRYFCAELPRDIDFLFSRNRLNVAVSRARCLAIIVASPRLLDVDCKTPEQMRLVNGMCRFVEMARAM